MVCQCGHDDHCWDEPTVCRNLDCKCERYVPVKEGQTVFQDHIKYLNQMEKTEEKVRYLLTNIKYLRNFPNKDFVFAYWVFCDGLIWNKPLTQAGVRNLMDPETIRRVKQKLVEKNPETYGPIAEDIVLEKEAKQFGIMEYVITS